MSRRRLLAAGTGLGAATWLGGCTADAPPPEAFCRPAPTTGPEAFNAGYPRAWFFRQTEDAELYDSYQAWENEFVHLNGIQGKAFPEERHFDHELTREYFTRFKERHPDKLVLLHFNGMGRRPAFNRAAFFSGHWLYYAGTRTTTAAARDANRIRVADTSLFKLERDAGMFKGMPDDIVIVPPTRTGLNWHAAEHVRLVNIDHHRRLITVRRGQFGSRPIAVPPGSYVAPHVRHRPPVLLPPESLWIYNLSSTGPRDKAGKRCIDVLVDELAGFFSAGGECEAFDGLEFDVLFFVPGVTGVAGFVPDRELIDVSNHGLGTVPGGRPGFVDDINTFGLGVGELCGRLRNRIPNKLILADGMIPEVFQRGFGVLNGMESEGFPIHRDPEFADWSGGLNRFEFWKSRGSKPTLNYLVFKYVGPKTPPKPGSDIKTYKLMRLSLAAAQFSDAGFALSGGWAPPSDPGPGGGVPVQVFDELWLGAERRANWLGRPMGDAVHLAAYTPNLLADRGLGSLIDSWGRAGFGVTRQHGGGLPQRARVSFKDVRPDASASDSGAPLHTLPLGVVELAGPDLYVELAMFGERMMAYPKTIARRLAVRAIVEADPSRSHKVFGWFDRRSSTSTFAFRDVGPGAVRLLLEVEGAEPVTIVRAAAHDHPDVMYREFECGLVLANPSAREFRFVLRRLGLPHSYRRLRGTEGQDPITNDGRDVGDEVSVGPIDALFLVRTKH